MAPVATILHADLDAFYASVEQMLDPVAARQADRRRRRRGAGGVVRGQAVRRARRHVGLAGQAAVPRPEFVGGHFKEYQRLGDEVMDGARRLHAARRSGSRSTRRSSTSPARCTCSARRRRSATQIRRARARRARAADLGRRGHHQAPRQDRLAGGQARRARGRRPRRRARVPRPAARRAGVGHRSGDAADGSPSAASTPSVSWPLAGSAPLRSLLGQCRRRQGRRARRERRPSAVCSRRTSRVGRCAVGVRPARRPTRI